MVSGGAGGASAVNHASGDWFFGGRDGIMRCVDLLGTPTCSIVQAGEVARIVADSATGTLLAARAASGSNLYLFDGSGWRTIAGPPAATGLMADTIGVAAA